MKLTALLIERLPGSYSRQPSAYELNIWVDENNPDAEIVDLHQTGPVWNNVKTMSGVYDSLDSVIADVVQLTGLSVWYVKGSDFSTIDKYIVQDAKPRSRRFESVYRVNKV